MSDEHFGWIEDYRCRGGGFAYLPKREPRIEPTVYAVLSGLHQEKDILWLSQLIQHATLQGPTLDFRKPFQSFDSKQSISSFLISGSPWLMSASLVALVAAMGQDFRRSIDLESCVDFLRKSNCDLGWESRKLMKGVAADQGWVKISGGSCWRSGNHVWTEPICWSLLLDLVLLREQPKLLDLDSTQQRLVILSESFCSDSGWNAGTNRTLGIDNSSYQLTTAKVLAILARVKLETDWLPLQFEIEKIRAALEALDHFTRLYSSRLTEAWNSIARWSWKETRAPYPPEDLSAPVQGESVIDVLTSRIAARLRERNCLFGESGEDAKTTP